MPVAYIPKHARKDTPVNGILASLRTLVTDAEGITADLLADGKTVQAAVVRTVTAQFRALLAELEKLS